MLNEAQRHEIVWEVEVQFHAFLTSTLFWSSCFSDPDIVVMSNCLSPSHFSTSPHVRYLPNFLHTHVSDRVSNPRF